MAEMFNEDNDKIVIYTHHEYADASKDILAEEVRQVLEERFVLSRFKSSKAEVYILHGRKQGA